MPYYGATYYATYNPYNYYGQGDACRNAQDCSGNSLIATIIGLCFFCCIFVIICVIVVKNASGEVHDDGFHPMDDGFVYEGPHIEFNET
jgi:hypothetical protein